MEQQMLSDLAALAAFPEMPPNFITESPCWSHTIIPMIQKIAPTTLPVLVEGETGTGKETVAQYIHSLSKRDSYVVVNCSAIPATLFHADLFGHVRGAYTGAGPDQMGRIQMAHDGTLVLNEIHTLDLELQASLLGVIETGIFVPLGSNTEKRSNFRVIALTNVDLRQEVAKGTFKKDLYYRLDVLRVQIPPLRKRPGDILPLILHYLRRSQLNQERLVTFSNVGNWSKLLEHPWEGNVRELIALVEKALVFLSDDKHQLTVDDLVARLDSFPEGRVDQEYVAPPKAVYAVNPTQGVVAFDVLSKADQKLRIEQVLETTRWSRVRAAEVLGMGYKDLLYRMGKLGFPKNIHKTPKAFRTSA